jgi:hypothetical protein
MFGYLIRRDLMKQLLLILFILTAQLTFSLDNTSDKKSDASDDFYSHKDVSAIINKDYSPDENPKSPVLLFNMGGYISAKSRLYSIYNGTNYYFRMTPYFFEPVPNDRWLVNAEAKLWGRFSFVNNNFLQFGAIGLMNFTNKIIPYFNIDELFLNWKYPLGKVVIGRTNYSMSSPVIFSGPLDGVELDINVPSLNFKTFMGYSGVLGIFNPYFNPYSISEYDRSYVEESNLLLTKMIIKANSPQSRRLFFTTDFDFYFAGQHLDPYFLMQYDVSALAGNSGYTISTFHVGSKLEGRIYENLYYMVNIAGMFGSSALATDSTVAKMIVACGFFSQLRYTITQAYNSTFFLNYAFGTGNNDSASFWSDSTGMNKETVNKFYYYGKFDGGFVLNPVLANLQIISFKYMISPVSNVNFRFSYYLSCYQALKLYPSAAICDPDAMMNDYIVSTEIDTGALFNFGTIVTLGFDFGILLPETAYPQNLQGIPRMKGGITLSINF